MSDLTREGVYAYMQNSTGIMNPTGNYDDIINDLSFSESMLQAEIKELQDELTRVNAAVQPYKAFIIRQELAQKQYQLQKANEGVGAATEKIKQDQLSTASAQVEDRYNQQGVYDAFTGMRINETDIAPTGEYLDVQAPWGSQDNLSNQQMLDYWAIKADAARASYGSAPMSAFSFGGYQPPANLRKYLTSSGARPLGAQDQLGAIGQSALWEQIAAQKAGGVSNLAEYMERVEPYIQTYGEEHKARSKALAPKAFNRITRYATA